MDAYPRGDGLFMDEGLKLFLVVGHIPFETIPPISYLLILQIQGVECFLKGIRFFFDQMAAFSFVIL